MDPSFTLRLNSRTLKNVGRISLFVLTLAAVITLLVLLKDVVTKIIFALFLAFLLDPVVTFLENHGVKRMLAVSLVFALILLMGALGFRFIAPVISNEIQQMSESIDNQSSDDVVAMIQEKLGGTVPILKNPKLQQELQGVIDQLLVRSMSVLVGLLTTVVSFIMVAFITFFFLKDGRRMKKGVINKVPNRYFEMALIILHKISTQLGRYLRGQLLVASIVGSLSIFALYLLDVRYYFFIGAIAGLANMIPYFGPIVGAVPAILVVFVDTGSLAAIVPVVIAFASIQLFENVFVSPFIVSKSVELHPLTIIVAILIGGQIWGIFGMLLAVPAASIVKVISHELIWGFKNYRVL